MCGDIRKILIQANNTMLINAEILREEEYRLMEREAYSKQKEMENVQNAGDNQRGVEEKA